MAPLTLKEYVFCERTGKIFDQNCECDHCSNYRKELRRTAKPTKINHSRKGCFCPQCEKAREYDKQYQKRKFEGHSLSSCKCSKCEQRRNGMKKRYERRKTLQRDRRYAFKSQVFGLLGNKCASCGFIPKHVCQIDFHERNGRIARSIGKNDTWTNPAKLRGLAYGRQLILKHIDEIVPLCRNCHVKLTCLDCKQDMTERIANWRKPT